MVILHVWIILVHIAAVNAQEQKKIEEDMTWQNANKSCTLSTPNLRYSVDGITVELETRNSTIVEGDKMWIGYVKALQVFQYIGCVSDQHDLLNASKQPSFQQVADPGVCYSYCGCSYFGLMFIPSKSVSKCFCIGDDTTCNIEHSFAEDGCTNSCENPAGTACGGGNDSKCYVSVYKHIPNISFVESSDKEYSCCGYSPQAPRYAWYNCSTKFLQMCEKGNGTMKDTYNVETQYQSWITTSEECFKRNKYPVTYREDNFLQRQTSTKLWTGMIRSGVIFKHNAVPIQQHLLKPGYITLVNHTITLKFNDKKSVLMQMSLCYKDATTTYTPGSTDANYIITSPSSNIMEQSEKSVEVEVYVGIFVALITLVVVIVLTLLFWRKRHGLRFKNKTKTKRKSHLMNTQEEDHHVAEEMASIRTEEPEEQHEYAVIDSVGNTASGHEDTYNASVPIGKCAAFQTENVYNILEPGADETNNHKDSKQNVNKTSSSSSVGIDNVYNKRDLINKTHADEYSHINVAQGIKNNTDNVYDKTNHVKNEMRKEVKTGDNADATYDMTERNIIVRAQTVNDNTYSHVDMKQENVDPDSNLYNTTGQVYKVNTTDNLYGKLHD